MIPNPDDDFEEVLDIVESIPVDVRELFIDLSLKRSSTSLIRGRFTKASILIGLERRTHVEA